MVSKWVSTSFNPVTLDPTEKTVNLAENVDPELLRSMREGEATGLTGMAPRRDAENDSIPKIAPKWLKYDR